MEPWGAQLYGDPCRDCGFNWALGPGEAVVAVKDLPDLYGRLLEGHSGFERHPDLAWTPAAYVSHVTDNLRNWAERLAGARLGARMVLPGYDPDLLASARRYLEIPPAAALWSLRHAVDDWVESVTAGLADDVVMQHATRGVQRAEDVARNNAHDGYHHLWDVERILRYAAKSD